MDWSIFHTMNGVVLHHEGGQDAAQVFDAWAVFILVAVEGSIWFFGRLGAALFVTTVGRPRVKWTVEQLSRISDPVVGTVTALIIGRRRGHTT